MTARLDDPPAVHHVNHVGVHRCREPVRDDDRGAAKRELAETLEPVCFGPRIERAGGLVENDNRCASQKRARERDALPLADAELRSTREPTAQQRLLLVRQARNDLFGAGSANSGVDLSVSRLEF